MLKAAGVVEADAPASDQPVNTLENLNDNVAAEIAAQTGANAGVEQDSTTPASGDPEAAPDGQVDGAPAEADVGKVSRINQQNAQMSAVLHKLGIDPNSDTMEAIQTGLVTPQEVLASINPAVMPTTKPQQITTPAPELTLSEQINNLQSVLKTPIPERGFSSEDIKERQDAFMGVIAAQAKEIQNITKTQDERDAVTNATNSRVAINNVFDSQIAPTLPADLPEETKQTLSAVFIASTNLANGELVETQGAAKAQSPNGYAFTAKKIAPEFNQALKAIFDAGAASTNPNPGNHVPNTGVHNVPNNAPTVHRPGVGGGPPAPANNTKFTLGNLQANVQNYIAAQQPQV
jgi:hypothetical protein